MTNPNNETPPRQTHPDAKFWHGTIVALSVGVPMWCGILWLIFR